MEDLLRQAYIDWKSGRAYIDGNNNYHIKSEGHSNGKIAKWNRAVKEKYNNVSDFHKDAIMLGI